jgi:hypothetical protein
MVELVDTQDLKSCSRKRSAGSIPALSTHGICRQIQRRLLYIEQPFFIDFQQVISKHRINRGCSTWFHHLA